MIRWITFSLLYTVLLFDSIRLMAQEHHHHGEAAKTEGREVEAQPFLAQALRVGEALTHIGSALPQAAIMQLQALRKSICQSLLKIPPSCVVRVIETES